MPSEQGLADALENFVTEWSQNYGINAEFHVTGQASGRRLPDVVETNLYRIAQEALNNTTKHSNADRAEVILDAREDSVRLIIEDDGTGFDIEARSEAARKNGHGLGLVGMKERVELLGGSLELDSKPGSGTTVFVTVPIREESS
jgi:signal transduction histidine kinase